eukprot:14706046-Heterocapsa_arctica.AAC.1
MVPPPVTPFRSLMPNRHTFRLSSPALPIGSVSPQGSVQLRWLALYGHPDSGTFWEKHCDMH